MEDPVEVQCPWCWEVFVTFFDISTGNQDYVEDCQVCCRPMLLRYKISRLGRIRVEAIRS